MPETTPSTVPWVDQLKLRVTPVENREGVWVVAPADFRAWAEAHNPDDPDRSAHCMIPMGFMLTGADWSWDGMIAEVDRADMVGVITNFDDDDPMLHGHQLRVIVDGRSSLRAFDIGRITVDDLDVSEATS